MCYCPYLAKLVLVVSWKEDNPGRRFYWCQNYSVLFDFKPSFGFFFFLFFLFFVFLVSFSFYLFIFFVFFFLFKIGVFF